MLQLLVMSESLLWTVMSSMDSNVTVVGNVWGITVDCNVF